MSLFGILDEQNQMKFSRVSEILLYGNQNGRFGVKSLVRREHAHVVSLTLMLTLASSNKRKRKVLPAV